MIGILKPNATAGHKYAVVLGVEGGTVTPLETYETKEEMEKGYKDWKCLASAFDLPKPVPAELIDFDGKTAKCKLLPDIE